MRKMGIGNIYPFIFLKYLQPTNYFHRKKIDGSTVFPVVEALDEVSLNELEPCQEFESEKSMAYDLSWQAIKSGLIVDAPTYSEFDKLPLADNYRFIRRYFHKAWVLYILGLRILSLKNPFKEISAFYKTRDQKRLSLNKMNDIHRNWEGFNSELIHSNPLVSVVIPTLNRYTYLKDNLNDFKNQDYKNFEIIIVDQSEPYQEEFYKNYTELNIQLVRQEEKALWLARNNAIKLAKGAFITFSEDDVRIEKDWISNHLKCIDFFKADVSAGLFYSEADRPPSGRSGFAISSQFPTGNAMIKRSVLLKTGLFDRQFEKQRMGDGEFGMRLYINGFKSISNPKAHCIDLKAGSGGLREMGSWDAFRPSNILAPRPIPSVIYYFRRYFGDHATRLALLKTVPPSILPYRFKRNRFMLLIGGLISLILGPLVFIQVMRSWNQAGKKIKDGPLIESYQ